MTKKTTMTGFAALIFTLTVALGSAYAQECMKGYGHGGGRGMSGQFFKKAHWIMKNQNTLGLSEEKIAAIKSLMLDTKKEAVKQESDIKVLSLDLKNQLSKNVIDVAVTNNLIDQKYELEKAKAKNSIKALAKLKTLMTQDEWNKLSSLKKESHQHRQHGEFQDKDQD